MAEVTEQVQQAQAVQPSQPTISVDTKSYTLKGAEIYGKMMALSANARDYNSEKMAGEQFYLYKFKGAAITVSPEFHEAFKSFQLVEVTLTGTLGQRNMADPNVAGGRMTVPTQSYTLDGIVTLKTQLQMLKMEESQKTYERAKKTISKIDVTKELTQAELDDLLA